MSYKNWRYDEILSAILPEDCEGVGGFSQIGHIIHLNLRDEIVDYKNIIGLICLTLFHTLWRKVYRSHFRSGEPELDGKDLFTLSNCDRDFDIAGNG